MKSKRSHFRPLHEVARVRREGTCWWWDGATCWCVVVRGNIAYTFCDLVCRSDGRMVCEQFVEEFEL